MKKITLLFAMLTMIVSGAWADVTAGDKADDTTFPTGYYSIYNPGQQVYCLSDGVGNVRTASGTTLPRNYFLVTYVSSKSAFTIQDINGNYLTYSSSSVTLRSTIDETNSYWYIVVNYGDEGTDRYDIVSTTQSFDDLTKCMGWNFSGNYYSIGANTLLGSYKVTDANDQWQLTSETLTNIATKASANLTTYSNLIGTGVGKFTDTNSNISAASTALSNATTDEARITAIQGAETAIKTLSLNAASTGNFFRIKSSVTGKYLSSTTSTPLSMVATGTDNATVWYYSANGLLNSGSSLYLNGSGKTASTTPYAATVSIRDNESNTVHIGTYNVTTNGGYIYNASGTTIDKGGSLGDGLGYDWVLEAVNGTAETAWTISYVGVPSGSTGSFKVTGDETEYTESYSGSESLSSSNVTPTTINGYRTFVKPSLVSEEGTIKNKLTIYYVPSTPISTLSELSNTNAYLIHAKTDEGYMVYNSSNGENVGCIGTVSESYGQTAVAKYKEPLDPTDDNNLWQIVKHGDNYYFYNIGHAKYANLNSNRQFQDEKSAVSIKENGASSSETVSGYNTVSLASTFGFGATSGNGYACLCINESSTPIKTWSYNDHGSVWEIIPVDAKTGLTDPVPHTITYNLNDGNDNITTEKKSVLTGSTATPTAYSYVSYPSEATITAEATFDDKTVDVTYTVSGLPFKPSTDYETANWYYLRAKGNTNGGIYYQYQTEDNVTKYSTTKRSGSNLATDNALWAFIGDPVMGYTIINKGAGEGYKLYSETAGTTSYPLMSSENETKWQIVKGAYNSETFYTNGFGFKHPSGDWYINDYQGNGYMCFWSDGPADDAGTCILAEAYNPIEAGYYRIKNKTLEQYLGNSITSEKVILTSDGTDPNTIYYYDGTYLMSFKNGQYFRNPWKIGTGDDYKKSWIISEMGGTDAYALYYNDDHYLDGETDVTSYTDSPNTATNSKWTLETVENPSFTESRTTAANTYGTICLPYDATVEGAVVMAFTGRSANGLVFTPVDGNAIQAGVPYLYRATADAQTFTTTGTTYTEATAVKGFTGSYTEIDLSKTADNTTYNYFLYTQDNKFHPAGTYVHMGAYRCYFPTLPSVSEARVSSNSVVFGIYGDATTGISTLNTSVDLNKDGKFIQNGRMVIVNNGKKFNAAGQIVK